MNENIAIGELILQKLKEQERSIAWLAKKVNCDRNNFRKLLKGNYITTPLLFRISAAMDIDFFSFYSEQLRTLKKNEV